MKIKPLQWEIISFILINLFLIASYYFMTFMDSFTNSLLEYVLFGPLFLIYSFTFIMFKIERKVKNLATKIKICF